MSAAAQVFPDCVLPMVWAYAAPARKPQPPTQPEPKPNMAFYRKYTEALLRRYLRMSLEAGRVPAMLGQEMFRARITHYRVESFEDVVIFLCDMDRCLQKLDLQQRDLIARITLQEYTVPEAAELVGLPPRTTIRRHGIALDRLTRILLHAKMLDLEKLCQ